MEVQIIINIGNLVSNYLAKLLSILNDLKAARYKMLYVLYDFILR